MNMKKRKRSYERKRITSCAICTVIEHRFSQRRNGMWLFIAAI
jgi:hypothetical protein